ncbi:energy transducer TonB [Gluconobacter thailandicus]|uniref:energy transducer TonB n=1 Tax=Gluconobacter thailandicus TaxID=257438 RepID=UPI0007779496|nr:energy transducer TonB [Gluconobacter thailandicus]KXV34129.1 energy transducer TonB [Gluconobacter thailandicus]
MSGTMPTSSGKAERREPKLFAGRSRTPVGPVHTPSGLRSRLQDYVPPATAVRPVLTPMMRPQTIVEPGPTVPFCISAGIHAAVLALLLTQHHGMHGSPAGNEPQVEMVFDQPPSKSSMQGPRAHEEGGAPPPPSPQSPQETEQEQQQPEQQQSAPTPAVPTPETPSAPPVPQEPSAELPKTTPSPAPVTPGSAPSQRSQQTTPHSHRAHRSVRPNNSNPLSHPMDYSFGEQPSPYRHRRGRPAGSGGPIDMSLGPLSMNGAINAPYQTRTSVKGVSEDYGGEIDRWIRSHMYYPEDAARAGEDGPSSVHVVLDRFGHVKTVRLTGQSGSYSLDAATTGMFQGAHLPPVPPDMKGDHFDIDVTINYILIRR